MNEEQMREYVAARAQCNDPAVVLISIGLLQLEQMKELSARLRAVESFLDSCIYSGAMTVREL